jgi:dihydropyrimidine dehydrogenase (NAD+) subunit PreA
MGVDPDTLTMSPSTGGKGSHGGYCGPAVKPIALNMVAEIARDPQTAGCRSPASAAWATGATRWTSSRWAAGNVQVCTAAMVYGFKIVQDMIDGLSNYMDEMGFTSVDDFVGKAVPTVTDWQYLNLNAHQQGRHQPGHLHPVRALPHCLRGHLAPGHHPSKKDGKRHFEVNETNAWAATCAPLVCPVPECITLRDLAPGEKDAAHRQGRERTLCQLDDTHPNNPMRDA